MLDMRDRRIAPLVRSKIIKLRKVLKTITIELVQLCRESSRKVVRRKIKGLLLKLSRQIRVLNISQAKPLLRIIRRALVKRRREMKGAPPRAKAARRRTMAKIIGPVKPRTQECRNLRKLLGFVDYSLTQLPKPRI